MFREFVSYLKSVFTEGHLPIFTIFTVLGITLFVFPQLAKWLIQNEQDETFMDFKVWMDYMDSNGAKQRLRVTDLLELKAENQEQLPKIMT